MGVPFVPMFLMVMMPMTAVMVMIMTMIMVVFESLGRVQGLAGCAQVFFCNKSLTGNQSLCRSKPQQVVGCFSGTLPVCRDFS